METNMTWVSVEEKLPEIGKEVLVFCKEGGFQVAAYNPENNKSRYNIQGWDYSLCPCCDFVHSIIYWMYLPEPPKD